MHNTPLQFPVQPKTANIQPQKGLQNPLPPEPLCRAIAH